MFVRAALMAARYSHRPPVSGRLERQSAVEISTASVGRHALMPPLIPGHFAAQADEGIDPYKFAPHM